MVALVRAIMRVLLRNRATLVEADWLSSSANATADMLSRRPWLPRTDWAVRPAVVAALSARWMSPVVDLMATPATRRFPRFVAILPTGLEVARDAFTISWNERAWLVPPLGLLARSVSFIREQWPHVNLIFVCTGGPSLPWFRWLRSMAREECELGRALEVVERLEGTELERCPAWTMTAFWLCGLN
jgi:hypothetical protein